MKNTIKFDRAEIMKALSTPLTILVLCVIIYFLNPVFFTYLNIINILRQISVCVITSLGVACVMLTGGIDLSIGSVLSFCSVITASLLSVFHLPLIPALLISLILGAAIGAAQGALIAKLTLQPFMVTLCGRIILRGAARAVANGMPISLIDDFSVLGNGFIGPIPVSVFIMVPIIIIFSVVLKYSIFGRYIYATGNDEEVTHLSGISTSKIKIAVYAISGFMAAFGGIMMTSRLGIGDPNVGDGLEMDAIAAAVIGGISLSGGKGKIIRVIWGAFLIGAMNNIFNYLSIQPFYQQIIKGFIILIALISSKLYRLFSKH